MSETVDLDIVRRCTLRAPIALDLDRLATAPATQRCLIVAKAVHETIVNEPQLRGDLEASGLMEWLRSESVRRTKGEVGDLPPLAVTVAATNKERQQSAV